MRLEYHAEAAVARLEIIDDTPIDADLAAVRFLDVPSDGKPSWRCVSRLAEGAP